MKTETKQTYKPERLQWWGYKHQSGTLHLKRQWSQLDIDEAHESPFCKIVVGPWEADTHEEAQQKFKEALAKAES